MEETFYKKCKCKTISGFSLTAEQIKKNEKYICQECAVETKLNKWSNSSEKEYLKQIRAKSDKERLEKIKQSPMRNIK